METVIWWLGPSHHTLFHSLDWVHRLWGKFLNDGWDSRLSACAQSSCQLKDTLLPGTEILWKQWSCWPVMWARPLPTPTNRWLLMALLTVCLPSFRWALWWSVLLGLDLFFAFFFSWRMLILKQRRNIFFSFFFFLPQALDQGVRYVSNWMCVVGILFISPCKLCLREACFFFFFPSAWPNDLWCPNRMLHHSQLCSHINNTSVKYESHVRG